MDSLMRICLLVVMAAGVPLSMASRSYSLLKTKESYLLFRPPAWATGYAIQHLSFQFKTHNQQGLLVMIKDGAVIVKLINGRVEATTSADGTPFQDSHVLSDNEYHRLDLVRDVSAKTVKLNLDGRGFVTVASNVPFTDNTDQTAVYIGGSDQESGVMGLGGCVDDVRFANSLRSTDQAQLEPRRWEEGAPVEQKAIDGCQDPCLTNNPCLNDGQCIHHGDGLTCDCSQTAFEGSDCSVQEASVVSLNGLQFVTYVEGRLDLDSTANKIVLSFKTTFREGLLLLADIIGEIPEEGTLATVSVFIARGKYLHVAISSPDQSQSALLVLEEVDITDGGWHSLVLQLEPSRIFITLDKTEKRINARGGKLFASFRSDLAIGGLPVNHPLTKQLGEIFTHVRSVLPPSSAFFIGCLRRVYYGPHNILEEVRNPDSHTGAIVTQTGVSSSASRVDSGECSALTQQELTITLLSESASVVLPQDGFRQIDLKMSFRLPSLSHSNRTLPAVSTSTLLSGDLKTEFGDGEFKIVLADGLHLEFNYKDGEGVQQKFQTPHPIGAALADGQWHAFRLLWPTRQGIRPRGRRQDLDLPEGNSTSATDEPTVEDPSQAAGVGDNKTVDTIDENALPGDAALTKSDLPETVPNVDSPPVRVDESAAVAALNESAAPVDRSRIRMQSPIGVDEDPAVDDTSRSLALPPGVDKRTTVTIELDGQIVEFFPGAGKVELAGPLVLGKHQENHGFTGCIRDLQDHKFAVDLRRITTDFHESNIAFGRCNEATTQSCQQNNPCEHGSMCRSGIAGLVCDCTGTGYTGRTCHIPLYVPTCADLFLSGERLSGVHLIDLDGSGPMSPVHVYCNMSQEAQGVTTITHNFQPIQLGKGQQGAVKYDIHYRQFDRPALRRLVDISLHCRQFISYKCRNTPLKLGSHTWFQSIADNGKITSFGSNNPGKCHCAVDGSACGLGAKKDLACNCDADDAIDRVDEGYYSGDDFVGITNMTFVNRPVGGSGTVSLGPLECFGKKLMERTVSFVSHEGSLSFPTLRHNEDISFFFKTALKSAVLLYQPSLNGSSSVRISVTNATTASLFLSVNGRIRQISVTSDKILSNGAWHSIRVQFGANELIFSVDLNSRSLSWNPDDKVGQYSGSLYLGGYPAVKSHIQPEAGLIGCVKGFFRGSQSVDVEAAIETSKSNEVRKGCQSSCSPSPCKNDGECFDKFGDFECICANPLAQSGRTCQNDINEKAVTFERTNSSAYIRVTTLDADILQQDILLSFRTHAQSGILLYAHDNMHNFAQLHLAHGREILFTFNNGNQLKQLSAISDTFSNGKWHQIYVKRESTNVTLTVDYLHGETIELKDGAKLMTKYSSRPFGTSTGESIIPARPYYPTLEFRNLYVGGVPSAPDEMRTVLKTFYGCIRGLKIGDHLFQLLNEPDSHIIPGIVEGCLAGCDASHPCKYSGACINNWGNATNPVECNCAGTSYGGPSCSEDIGTTMDGSSQLIVEYRANNSIARALDFSKKLDISLAFSTSAKSSQPMALLFLQSYQKLIELAMGLNAEGELTLDVYTPEDNSFVHQVIEGNYTDGERHFVTVHTSAYHVVAEIGNSKIDMPVGLIPMAIQYVTVGGIQIPISHEKLNAYTNYTGCISNVRIEISDEPLLQALEPLKLGVRQENLPSTRFHFTGPVLEEGQCAAPPFPAFPTGLPPAGPMQTNVTFPPWDVTPAGPQDHAHQGDVAPTAASPVPLSRNTGIIVGVICGIFILAILIGICVYVRRAQKNKKNAYTPQELQSDPAANDALLTRHDPAVGDDIIPPNREKIRPVANAAFARPVTNYIDETIIPSPRTQARELEKHLDGSNGSSIHDDRK